MAGNGLFRVLPGIIMLSMVTLLGACGRKTYSPYRAYEPYEKKDIPSPQYEGREDRRFYPTNRIDDATSITIAGFHQPIVEPPKPKPAAVDTTATLARVPDFQLGAGDVLEIIYQLKSEESPEAYQLQVSDAFRVSFLYTPKLDAEVSVRPDGKVNLPLIGDISAAGKTTEEVRSSLVAEYSKHLKAPVIQVFVTKSNNAIEELKRAITTAPRGQSRLTPIRPDGYMSLPLIGDILAEGKTIPELSTEIVSRYRRASVRNIDVTVVLLEVKSPVVYVLGEVGKPGPLVMTGQLDIWRAVGLAGGFLTTSDADNVTISRTTKNGEERYTMSFNEWTAGLPNTNPELIRGDIINIPKMAGQYVYVQGQVEKPGRITLDQGEQLRVSQALAMSGKILSSAGRRQVYVLSRSGEREPVITEVDLRALTNPRKYDKSTDYPPRDPILKPGDVVYVSASGIGNFNRFAEAWFRNGLWTVVPFIVTYNLN